jgi:hypothetical protein
MFRSLERKWVRYFGTLEKKERFNTITRANYAYGMIKGAVYAKSIGQMSISSLEFGVSTGAGLMGMENIAEKIHKEIGVKVHVIGYDTGDGLPEPIDYRDHPETWTTGDFIMSNRDDLLRNLREAKIVFGDVKDTVDEYENFFRTNPIAFVSIDLDYYSSTMSCLEVFKFDSICYLPAFSVFFDDVSWFTCNRWCGELLAIDEFNEANALRKFDVDRTLPGDRPYKNTDWYKRMYVAHILDHELRTVHRSAIGT